MALVSAENRGLRLPVRYLALCLVAIIFIFPISS
jgi:hypothetical protein